MTGLDAASGADDFNIHAKRSRHCSLLQEPKKPTFKRAAQAANKMPRRNDCPFEQSERHYDSDDATNNDGAGIDVMTKGHFLHT